MSLSTFFTIGTIVLLVLGLLIALPSEKAVAKVLPSFIPSWIAQYKWLLSVLLTSLVVIHITAGYLHRKAVPIPEAPRLFTSDSTKVVRSKEGFTWIRRPKSGTILGIDKRDPSGAVWSAITVVVSRQSDQVASFSTTIYGNHSDVYHYYLRGGSQASAEQWQIGHVPPQWSNRFQMSEALTVDYVIQQVELGLYQQFSPIDISIEGEGADARLAGYHKESGRHLHWDDESKSYVLALVRLDSPRKLHPGVFLEELTPQQDEPGINHIEFMTLSVHGEPLPWADIDFTTPYGYSYSHRGHGESAQMSLSTPYQLSEITVHVSQHGYNSVKATIPTNAIVTAVLEPGSSNTFVEPVIGSP